jgi:hypothetical protein
MWFMPRTWMRRNGNESVEFQDASLPRYELESSAVELRNLGIRIIERSSVELKVCVKRRLHVCCGDSCQDTTSED